MVIWVFQQLLYSGRNGVSINLNTNRQGGGLYMNSGMDFGHGNFSMNAGYGNTGAFSSLLSLLISIFVIVLVVTLVLAVIVVIKNIIFTPQDVQVMKKAFAGIPKAKCSICSNELNEQWKVCPYCGKEKVTIQKTN